MGPQQAHIGPCLERQVSPGGESPLIISAMCCSWEVESIWAPGQLAKAKSTRLYMAGLKRIFMGSAEKVIEKKQSRVRSGGQTFVGPCPSCCRENSKSLVPTMGKGRSSGSSGGEGSPPQGEGELQSSDSQGEARLPRIELRQLQSRQRRRFWQSTKNPQGLPPSFVETQLSNKVPRPQSNLTLLIRPVNFLL